MKFFKNYSLTILLGLMFFISWAGQFFAGWKEYLTKQLENHQAAKILGHDGYIWEFLSATFENWQSEFLQTMIFVILSTYFIHKNSPQSRDSDDEMLARLNRIEKALEKK